MGRLDFVVEWLPAPDPQAGKGFGPELATWGRLKILLDGECITSQHPADFPGDDSPWVIGGLSGLAEWVVDSWLPVHFEMHTPFPKFPPLRADRGAARFPGVRDVLVGWADFIGDDDRVSGDVLGAWQQRHTLGEARTDLALPSMVFVPEGAWIGLGFDHLPAALDPTVRFTPPPMHRTWPQSPLWLPREDVSGALRTLVDGVIEHALSLGAGRWAKWLRSRWESVRTEAQKPEVVRKWGLGKTVAERWDDLVHHLGPTVAALEGVLMDSASVDNPELLASIRDAVAAKIPNKSHPPAPPCKVNWGFPPFHEGYRLAQVVRRTLDLADQPLGRDLGEITTAFGVTTKPLKAVGLFRSAVWTQGGCGVVVWAEDEPRHAVDAPRRFAIAAAMGRFLADFDEGRPQGAAHGSQSRWRATQFANAFAAELILPKQAIERFGGDIAKLSKEYVISRIAAEWHVANRLSDCEL